MIFFGLEYYCGAMFQVLCFESGLLRLGIVALTKEQMNKTKDEKKERKPG